MADYKIDDTVDITDVVCPVTFVKAKVALEELDDGQILPVDEHLLGVAGRFLGDHVQQRAVAVLLEDGAVERDVAVEGNVLLPRGRLDGGDDLAGDAQLGEGAKGRQAILAIVANGLVQADHALLHDVLVVCADEEIAARLGPNEVFVLVQQIFQRRVLAVLLGQRDDFLVRHGFKALIYHEKPPVSLVGSAYFPMRLSFSST